MQQTRDLPKKSSFIELDFGQTQKGNLKGKKQFENKISPR